MANGTGQQAYWNYEADDATLDINRWLLGILEPGRYRGFDFSPVAGLTLTLQHGDTGLVQTRSDAALIQTGIVLSRQGVVVQEDTDITVPVSPGSALPRIDLVVCTHQYQQVAGGSPAQYSVVQGTPSNKPVAPDVIDERFDVGIGELYLPAGCTSLAAAGVVYTPREPANVGGRYHLALGTETTVRNVANTDCNDLTATGLFYITPTANQPITQNSAGFQYSILVAASSIGTISQLAMTVNGATGVYFRSRGANGTWGVWLNLDPTDAIAAAVGPVIQRIADLEVYTRRVVGDLVMRTKLNPADFDSTGKGKTTVPSAWGWALANGQNGTQDMGSRFPVGYDGGKADSPTDATGSLIYNTGKPGNTGGEDWHTLLTGEIPSHTHTNDPTHARFAYVNGKVTLNSDTDDSPTEPNLGTTSPIQPVGGDGAHENRPPYRVVVFLEWIGR